MHVLFLQIFVLLVQMHLYSCMQAGSNVIFHYYCCMTCNNYFMYKMNFLLTLSMTNCVIRNDTTIIITMFLAIIVVNYSLYSLKCFTKQNFLAAILLVPMQICLFFKHCSSLPVNAFDVVRDG